MKLGHPPVTACEHVVVVYMSNFIETFLWKATVIMWNCTKLMVIISNTQNKICNMYNTTCKLMYFRMYVWITLVSWVRTSSKVLCKNICKKKHIISRDLKTICPLNYFSPPKDHYFVDDLGDIPTICFNLNYKRLCPCVCLWVTSFCITTRRRRLIIYCDLMQL